MTSRERVAAAFAHTEPDRVPIDIGTSDTFIAREVYEGLAELLGTRPTAAADYRRYIKPRHAQIVAFIKARADAKIIHHCAQARFWERHRILGRYRRDSPPALRHAGGGYVLAPSHIIQRFTPPENVRVMYQTALDCG